MTVLIDLESYAAEVEAFAALADGFVDGASSLRLAEMARLLRTGVGEGKDAWWWETRAPIIFKPSNKYDGPEKTHLDTSLELTFRFKFQRDPPGRKKSPVWEIGLGSTKAVLKRERDEYPVHFDYKNKDQWGPQAHFQVSEDLVSLPIPRIFVPAFLPTDAADIMLSELHPLEWRALQSERESQWNIALIRNAQEHRSRAYLEDIARQWRDERRISRLCLLQNYSSALVGLPNHNDVRAAL